MTTKKFNKFMAGFAFSVVAAGGLASCSSDLNEPTLGGSANNMLAKNPKIIAYSGDHIWSANPTRSLIATRSSEEFSDVIAYQPVWKENGAIDYNKERETVTSVLSEGTQNEDALNKDFMYHAEEELTFEMFPVFSSTSHSPNYLGIFYYDSTGQLHENIIWDKIDLYNLQDWQNGGKSKGIRITVAKGYKFGFFTEGKDGNGNNVRYYSLSSLNPEYEVFQGSGTSRVHAGTFERNEETYICFEDWVDFDYQDIVFASFAHLPTVDEDDLLPDEEESVTPGNPDVTDPDEDDDDPSDDDNSIVSDGKGFEEVEINLALDDKEGRYLESHLSMHVRSATDVEVFIPVPAKYYCDADDMNIILDKAEEFVHGGPFTTELNVGGNLVYVNIEFKENGIRIWTDGINDAVIEFCRENYNDGITFEIWNYFNDPEKVGDYPISMEELKSYLDRSTVKFLDKIPETYINAFGEENGKYGEGGSDEGKDFHVTPEDQIGSFHDKVEEPHLNGSDINEIYKTNAQ